MSFELIRDIIVLNLPTIVAIIVAGILFWQIYFMQKGFKGRLLFDILNTYRGIQKYREVAEENKDYNSVQNYYRALFDLHWTQFHLWRKGHIDNEIMKEWHWEMYNTCKGEDKISYVGINGALVDYPYEAVWNAFKKNPLVADSKFVDFMKIILDDLTNENLMASVDKAIIKYMYKLSLSSLKIIITKKV